MRVIALAIVLSTVLAFAAGCGSGPSAEEKWADSLCTDVANWQQQIQKATSDATSELKSPSTGTVAAIKTNVQQAAGATKQFAANLKTLGAPNTDSGAQAKQQLDSLARQLENTVNQAKQTVADLPQNATLSQTVTQLATLGPALQSMIAKTKSTLASIQSSASDLKKGFDQASSCKQFR